VPGCPGNDGKSHVYIWVVDPDSFWYHYYPDRKYETCVCCGCGKRKPKTWARRIN
jgi:hypothetical protein